MRFAAIGLGMVCLAASVLCAAEGGKSFPKDVKDVLDNATELDVFLLSEEAPGNESMQGCKVLGKTTVKDAATCKRLLNAVEDDIENPLRQANCFSPAYGIRAQHKDQTVELVICYKCRGLEYHIGGKGSPTIATNKFAMKVMDEILREAKVLPPK